MPAKTTVVGDSIRTPAAKKRMAGINVVEARRKLFTRPNRRVGSFAMIQPQLASAHSAGGAGIQKVGETKADLHSHFDRTWQPQAYDFLSSVGELGYIVNLTANAVASCHFHVMERESLSSRDEVLSEDPRALRVMSAFTGPRGGVNELKRKAALHLTVAGEALDVDTLVPTPDGFTTMGALQDGDIVLGGDGRPCRVVHAFDVLTDRDCYEVRLGGDVRIVADGDHRWLTSGFLDRVRQQGRVAARQQDRRRHHDLSDVPPSVVTTTEMLSSLAYGPGHSNHAIGVVSMVGTAQEVEIDPYVLGYWLGDGVGVQGCISIHTDDQPHVRRRFEEAGYGWSPRPGDRRGYSIGILGLQAQLRRAGLLGDKHIPHAYLRHTEAARWALLQGLIDSDGHVDKRGSVEFSNINRRLLWDVVELAASLGLKPGRPRGHRIHFRAGGMPVASLPRKANRIGAATPRDRYHYVKAIEQVKSRPVRCIAVDSPDHTYLVTERFVRTHNSYLVGTPQEDEVGVNLGIMWEFLSTEELRIGRDGKAVRKRDGSTSEPLAPEAYVARLWRGDPRYSDRADSSVRRVLTILQELVTLTQMVDAVAKCVDDETEILTRQGWRSHDRLGVGDEVLTLDHNTGLTGWEPVLAVNRHQLDDQPMVSMEAKNHSSLTTPNHRWPVLHRSSGRDHVADSTRQWRRSDTLSGLDRIITGAPSADVPRDAKHTDDLVEMVAWLWTEGYVRNGQIDITQSYAVNGPKVNQIRRALTALYGPASTAMRAGPGRDHPPRWRESRHEGKRCAVFHLNQAASAPLLAVAPAKVVTLDFVQSLTRAQLQLFLDTSMAADGHTMANGHQTIFQNDPARLDALDLTCVLLGLSVRRTTTTAHLGGRDFPLWGLSIYRTSAFSVKKRKVVTFTGTVWCPTTGNGTWLARRRGTTWWTGNSRLSAGILFVPQEMSFAEEDDEATDTDTEAGSNAIEPFIKELIDHLSSPVRDRTSAAGLVPLVMRGPAEMADKVKMIDLARDLNGWAMQLRTEAVERLGFGLDIPPELIKGKQHLNHWTGHNVDTDFVIKHVGPPLELLVDFCTHAYLRPMLEEFEGMDAADAARFRIEGDISPIISKTDESNAGRLLFDRIELSGESARSAAGFNDDDAPTDAERRTRRCLDLVAKAPVLAPYLLRLVPGFEDVDIPPGMGDSGKEALPPDPLATGPASGTPLYGSPPPNTGPHSANALADRLATAADAAIERAFEKAGARVITLGRRDTSLKDRLAAVSKVDALSMMSGAEMARLKLNPMELLGDAWESFSIRGRGWMRDFLLGRGCESYVADDLAAAAMNELCKQLDMYALANMHRPLARHANGLRIPEALVGHAVELLTVAA